MAKVALGKGLGALINTRVASPTPAVESGERVQRIPLDQIVPTPLQPRTVFRDEHLEELVASIREQGIIQPLIARQRGDKYELIAGERRWRAFQKLSIKTIPARVMTSSDASSASLALIENLQRADLNPLEEAHGYASLIRDFDLTQDAAAQRVGKGRATVANSLRLLGLEAELQGYVGKGMLSVGHAKVLLGVENSPERLVLARRALEQGLSVRALEELLRSHKTGGGSGKKRRMPGATATALADIEKKLTSHLGARTTLRHSEKHGRIIIEYAGNDDLQRVMEKMGLPPA